MITPMLPALRPPFSGPTGGPINGGTRSFGSLFRNRTGIWYDPQDFTIMFQDAQGTLPVYRPGSGQVDPPVGLALDKSLGLELGPELFTNGDFSNGDTGLTLRSSVSVVGGRAVFDGVTVVPVMDLIVASGVPSVAGAWYKCTYTIMENTTNYISLIIGEGTGTPRNFVGTYTEYIKAINSNGFSVRSRIATGVRTGSIDNISIREIKGYHAYQNTPTARPKLSGRYNQLGATETLSTQSVTTVATDYTFRFEGTGTVTLSGTATGVLSAGMHTVTCTAGSLTLTVVGSVTRADLRVKRDGSSLPPYQRVDDANTYDTTGFPLYLKRDRVDDQHLLTIPAGGITGSYAEGTVGGPIFGTVEILVGAYALPSSPPIGPSTCTQWIAIDGTLTTTEQAVLERYVTSKNGGGIALQLELIETLEMLETLEMI